MNRNVTISTYEDNTLLFKNTTTCLLEDNYLTFNTDNDTIKINLDTKTFIKDNVESTLKITMNKCQLTIKELKNSIDIPIDYINFNNDNNKNITFEYKLASQEYTLKIIIEIGEINNEI